MTQTEQMSLAQKYNLLPNGNPADETSVDIDSLLDFDDYRAFVISPQPMHREEMLNLLFKSGVHRCFSYSHLYSGLLDPELGIALHFSDHIVNIRGLRLTKGYQRILDRRLLQAAEADEPASRLVKAPEPLINRIAVYAVTQEILEQFGFNGQPSFT